MAMRSIVPLLVSAVALASCASGVSYQASLQDVPAPPSAKMYRTMHTGPSACVPLSTFASQTVIAPHWAVTNAHAEVIADNLVAESRSSDLALIAIDGGAPLPFGTPHNGDHITAYGSGCSGDQRVAHGVITDVRGLQCWGEPGKNDPDNPCKRAGLGVTYAMIMTADSGEGFSGGPIINDAGELIGVMEAEITDRADTPKWDSYGKLIVPQAQPGAILQKTDTPLPKAPAGQAVAIGYSIQAVTAEFFPNGDVALPVLADAKPARPASWLERYGYLILMAAII